MQDDISGWNEWNAAFAEIEEISSPSELHGILTGIVCVANAPTQAEWIAILETLQVTELDAEALALLTEEAEDIAAALQEGELDYLPILPDDQHVLSERVDALADWCAGVVLGFGLSSGRIRNDEKEWIQHLQEVASVGYSDEDDDEDGEASYHELYEFVRLIPISLATGREKTDISQTPLLKGMKLKESSQVVEMFTPHRPS